VVESLKRRLKDTHGGLAFLIRLYERFAKDNCFFMAAAIAYYGVFSLFPLLLAFVSVVGFILPGSPVQQQIENLIMLYVPGSAEYLIENLSDVVRVRGQMGLFGLATLLWVSSAVFNAMTRSLNEIWGTVEESPFWRTRLVGMGMVLVLGLLVILSLVMSTVYQVVSSYESELMQAWGVQPLTEAIPWQLVGRVLPSILAFITFTIIYQFFPARRLPFRDVWPGALLGTIGFEGAKAAFGAYLRTVSHFRLIHGSLTTFVLLLLWIYIVAMILLLCAEVNVLLREIRHERR